MRCKVCGVAQREPVILHPHYPRTALAQVEEPKPVNFNDVAYWACERCSRKHNPDGSLYQPSGN